MWFLVDEVVLQRARQKMCMAMAVLNDPSRKGFDLPLIDILQCGAIKILDAEDENDAKGSKMSEKESLSRNRDSSSVESGEAYFDPIIHSLSELSVEDILCAGRVIAAQDDNAGDSTIPEMLRTTQQGLVERG